MVNLSILCITREGAHARPFLLEHVRVGADVGADVVIYRDPAPAGFQEPLLADALTRCRGDYIFRIDDDELCASELIAWLRSRQWESGSVWSFNRANLFRDELTAMTNWPLWPDPQVRLTTREFVVREPVPHAKCAGGYGTLGTGIILHHKFLVRSYDERKALSETYERIKPGCGTGKFLAHQVPEDCFAPDRQILRPVGELC